MFTEGAFQQPVQLLPVPTPIAACIDRPEPIRSQHRDGLWIPPLSHSNEQGLEVPLDTGRLGLLDEEASSQRPCQTRCKHTADSPPRAEYEFPSFGLPGAVSAERTRCHCGQRATCISSSSSGWTVISALIRCAPHCGHRSAADHAPHRGHLVCDCFLNA